ncbi:MAG: flagellar protein FlaR [Armatimonadetes bacterium]|nr:flagellar protein FlaR [Armatimonadota bacterium]
MRRVMVIGNGGGGKTTLSLRLAEAKGLPLTEVDLIQFRPGWERTPADEVRARLDEVHDQDAWLIDGFGPWDSIERRAELADTIIFVDHPIWVHFWWACERQIAAALGQERVGGPEGCDLREVTKEMFETLWRVHENLRPMLVELVEHHPEKTIWIKSPEELDAFLAGLA